MSVGEGIESCERDDFPAEAVPSFAKSAVRLELASEESPPGMGKPNFPVLRREVASIPRPMSILGTPAVVAITARSTMPAVTPGRVTSLAMASSLSAKLAPTLRVARDAGNSLGEIIRSAIGSNAPIATVAGAGAAPAAVIDRSRCCGLIRCGVAPKLPMIGS